jgi:hypothetical protein
MRCSKCGSDNREGAKFCNDCGTLFGTKCAACDALNQPGAKFCDECGAALMGDVLDRATAVQTGLALPASGGISPSYFVIWSAQRKSLLSLIPKNGATWLLATIVLPPRRSRDSAELLPSTSATA